MNAESSGSRLATKKSFSITTRHQLMPGFYSLDMAPSDYELFPNIKILLFLRDQQPRAAMDKVYKLKRRLCGRINMVYPKKLSSVHICFQLDV